MAAELNIFNAEVRADPYPVYRRLQREDPVHWDEQRRYWLLTRYADVVAALRDPRFSSLARWDPSRMPESLEVVKEEMQALRRFSSLWTIRMDPPDHTRLRGLMNKAFTPRMIETLRPRIQQIVDDLLDAVQPAGHMDIIHDLAYPLPTIVIAEMLGLPAEDRDRFKHWCDAIVAWFGYSITPDPAECVRRANQSVLELREYLHGIVSQRRVQPREDLLSALVATTEQGDRLSEEELLATCVLLLFAGHETTTNLIGNGLLALLHHPDQLRMLRNDPVLIGPAVEELLRFDSPIQTNNSRLAKEDVEIGGRRIQIGEMVVVVLGAANRDSAQFADPDRLDITRRDNRHVAFGYGIHFCIGAPLARVEGQLAIGALLRRMPALRAVSDRIEWQTYFPFRGLRTLPVAF